MAQRGHHERLGRLGAALVEGPRGVHRIGDSSLGSSYDGVHPSGDIEREVKLSNYRGVTPAVPSHNWEQVFAFSRETIQSSFVEVYVHGASCQ